MFALIPTPSAAKQCMSDDIEDVDDEAIPEPDAAAEAPKPRANAYLSGHETAEAALLEAHHAGKLPHALILGVPRGGGKATRAVRLARCLPAQTGGAAPGLFAP